MPRPKATRERLASKACDSCKVRKIRCTEVAPCAACKRSGIECTFESIQAQRGPRGLRSVTIRKIRGQDQGTRRPRREKSPLGKDTERIHQLIALIDVYASRLFPVWPILDPTQLRQALLTEPCHAGTLRLANAVGLAAVAQLKLDTAWQPDLAQIRRDGSSATEAADQLDELRVSFFLHVHHENSTPGGRESLLYLREAITLAQILRLEHEGTYTSLPDADQHIYRRVLWLLFVTERGVALLHKLPPILKPNILFPWHSTSDETSQVLPAFLKLVQLFWIFDQSGIIEILQNAVCDTTANPYPAPLASACLELLQPKLQQFVTDDDWNSGTDEQRADVFLTRQWMRAILWRAALRFGVSGFAVGPVDIAREFLSLTARVPPTALESHGAALFKTFEIATTVIDSMAGNYCLSFPVDYVAATLFSLRNMLTSFRGGKNKLLPLLEARMQSTLGFGAPARPLNLDDEQQMTVPDSNGDECRGPGCTPSPGEDLLMGLSIGISAQDGSQFPWAGPDLTDLLDFSSRLTDVHPNSSVLEAAEGLYGSGPWVLDQETPDGNGLV